VAWPFDKLRARVQDDGKWEGFVVLASGCKIHRGRIKLSFSVDVKDIVVSLVSLNHNLLPKTQYGVAFYAVNAA